jgi:tRNA modification GTPase
VINKVDLLGSGRRPSATVPQGLKSVEVSALNGSGFDQLLGEIAGLAEGLQTTIGDERIAINARHAHYLAEARTCLAGALEKMSSDAPGELLASDLRGALGALGEISGKVDNERMLDQLFASFCIGK